MVRAADVAMTTCWLEPRVTYGAQASGGGCPGLLRLLFLGEVVDGEAADGFGLEVGRYPGGDLRGAGAAAEAFAALADVVVDLALGHHGLELGQGGGRVGAVEAADRYDRVSAGREPDRRGLLGTLGGRDPLVLRRVLLEQLDQRAADLGAAGQGAHRGGAAARPARPPRRPA